MIRILQSSWLVALLGSVLYLATTVALIRPNQFDLSQLVPPDHPVSNEPSWKFKNPEFDQWLAQLKNEKETVAQHEQQLKEWQTRLEAERQNISTITQTIAQLQADFDRNVIRFKAQESDNVKRQAKLIAAMSPQGATAMLGEMADDDVIRILYAMKVDEASLILDNLSKSGKNDAGRAANLTVRLRQVLPPATNAAPAASP
jgi:flagellar motility protein MotE (MotC chaperone)